MVKLSQPKGVKTNKGFKIAVVLEEEVFIKVRARAGKERKFFSEVLNDITKCGLLDIEECELDEANDNAEIRASGLN
jgi:hypothetical protein